MKNHELSPEEHDRGLRRIQKRVFGKAVRSEQPEIFILGGQPGSGKSTLISELARDKSLVIINGDEYRRVHPRYKEIMQNSPADMATLTDPDVRKWTKSIFDEAIRRHYNIVFESTMRQDEPLCTTLKTLRQEGYKITACVMAVCDRDSWSRAEKRYENDVKKTGYGRKVPEKSHAEAYENMPLTLRRIEKEKLVDVIRVHDYQHKKLYVNELINGEWTQKPLAMQTVLDERLRRTNEILRSTTKEAEPGRSYTGPVIVVDKNNVFQRTDQGIIRHALKTLDKVPEVSQRILSIENCKGRGFVREAKASELTKDQGLSRG